MRRRTEVVCGLLIAMLFSCGKNRDSKVVAHVGKVQLTMDALSSAMPSIKDRQLSKLQAQNYVQHWIESELVYQKAIKEKIDALPEVKEQLRRLEKDFIVSVYVQQKVDNEIQITDEDLESYYEHNSEEFRCDQDLYKVEMILTETLNQAKEARTRVANGEAFSLVAKSVSLDPGGFAGASADFLPLQKFSAQLAAAIPRLQTGELSQPIRSEVGYHIVRVLQVRAKGSAWPFAEVKELIIPRVRAQKREEGYRRLISTLSEHTQVETDFESLQQ
jgi:EpsD family peptidyl-prolyl cis-trans isomerase